MKLEDIGTSIESLPGIGPSTAKLFAKLNIFTVASLLSSYPRDYDDRSHRISLQQGISQSKVNTICKVLSHNWFGYGKMKTLKIAVTDGTATAYLIAFNRSFLEKALPEGSIITVNGQFYIKYNELQSSSFEAQKIADEGEIEDYKNAPVPGSGVIPVYHLTEGLSQKVFHKAVATALRLYGKGIDTTLPQDIIKSRNLLTKPEAIYKIHCPSNIVDIEKARNTLIYEELFYFEYKMAQRSLEHRGSLPTIEQTSIFEQLSKTDIPPSAAPFFKIPENKDNKEMSREIEEKLMAEAFEKLLSPKQKDLFNRLPFSLTKDQMNAIAEMNSDIDKSQSDLNLMKNNNETLQKIPFSMQRLLQGDVGSGKTLVAFFICLRVIDYGGQCALMAPTELLARQHAENAAKMLEPIGVKVAFLTGNLKTQGRLPLLNALKEGNIDIVIGTHALFSKATEYKNLELAIIDEQHRFGVTQRESIIAKGRYSKGETAHTPDLLMMSATPIPQTLALTVFGDLDVSTIKTMPKGRKPVVTYLSVMGHESNVYEAVRKELKSGHQAYFVYPRIGEDENSDKTDDKSLKSAEEMFDFLSNKVYPEYKCALIHSKVPEDEQKQILNDFTSGKINILIATTVVEVGVDVANATCIVIEHADRFGLAELHQLRGRVGRSSLQSYCFLIYGKNITEIGKQRLKALHSSTDGFAIAEQDLLLRGPGEVSGTAQSGYLTLGIADLARDKDILKIARYDAFNKIQAT